ncbi:peptide ABC transporter substrate-binding protein [Thermohalobacter berrensis]|uniref:Solute-binding protein family 5 domain-containing protein n=1 Tax=Thermohalobacter berrensis TaxID=99594 RepID=A0A419SUU4_9FIRM|nr:peptide ABC transporter substrate-binding protein [Thermohalobacter berrensis]RKD28991.1 hypothetical protein BET03_06500 [Thermohalobacter berrensis]
MRKGKWLVLLLVFVMVASLALTGCGGGQGEDTQPQDQQEQGAGEDTDKQEQGTDEAKEEPKGEKLAEEQVLRVNLGEEPPCLDPQISTDAVSSEVLLDTLEGIIRMDNSGQIKKGSGMAEDWEINEEGTVYTFHLRDAEWEDGQPVTAHDFEFAWKRALAPETASSYAFIAYDIKNAEEYNTGKIKDPDKVGVKALDDKTLQVTLKAPNPAFISKLQHSTFLPVREDLIEKWGDKYGSEAEYFVACGPFKITEWIHEQKLVMEKNENYWDADAVKLERIEALMIDDSNTMINLYETGQLDYTVVPSQFIDKYKDEIMQVPRAAVYYFNFNAQNDIFKSAKVRKAFALAIDRAKILELRTKGMTPPAFGFVPPGIPGVDGKTFREMNGDLFQDLGAGEDMKEKVNQLLDEGLAEVGKTREDLKGLKFLTYNGDNNLQVAQIWQQYWRENLGVNVEIEQSTFKIKLDKEDKGNYQFSFSGWIGDYNDPMTYMDMWITNGEFNDPGWSNEEYDKLIEKAQTTMDPKERMQAMLDAEKILMEEMPISPYMFAVDRIVQRPYVKGMIRLPLQVENGKKYAYILEH